MRVLNQDGLNFEISPEDSALNIMPKAPGADLRSLQLLDSGKPHVFYHVKQPFSNIVDQLNQIQEPTLFLFHLKSQLDDPYLLGITRENQSSHINVTSKCDWKDAAFTLDKYLPSLESQINGSVLRPVFYQVITHPANELDPLQLYSQQSNKPISRENRTSMLRLLGKETCWYAEGRPVKHKILTAFASSRRTKHMPKPFDPFDL
jgi:hypothetical protein